MTDRSVVVGIDVGGTFTDVFVVDEATGDHAVGKVTSTRTNEALGFGHGIRDTIGHLPTPTDIGDLAAIIHGTTVGTNALLERKGAVTGIIATDGFTDVLEMRRRDRPRTWGLWGDFEPIVPRDRRLGVTERTLADGTVTTVVDPSDVVAAAEQLLAAGAVAVAVTFLHSYASDANEAAAAAALRAMWPNDHVSISSEILPEIREFERTSTTALNAYLQPVVGDYLETLQADLARSGFDGQFLIVGSNGGVMTVESARRFPIRTALSGPAAGVIAAAHIATSAGIDNVLCGDMGGTSFDVSVVVDGRTALSAQSTIDFGLVIRSPMIEITTIGAGGGSIAWVDRGGILQIGPESAGGVPGPVCYGGGNDRPTVTDANVVLGRINADRPIGGRERLDVDAARVAIDQHVGSRLGLSVDDAAEAILRVATSRLSGALRLVSIERGHDPTRFWTMPFGGAGALHCCAFVDDVGLAGALVPRHPGVISALGCLIADMRHDHVRTINSTLDALDVDRLGELMSSTRSAGDDLLDQAGTAFVGRSCHFTLDMSYVGQTHTVEVPLSTAEGASPTLDELRAAFDAAYIDTYGRLLADIPVRLLTLRTAVIGHRPTFDLSVLAPSPDLALDAARSGSRDVYFGGQWRDTAIWNRLDLPVGASIVGPAILEQPDATTVVDPGFVAVVDEWGNLRVTRQ